MAEQKFVDVAVLNKSGQTVTLRYPEGHSMIEHLLKLAKRDDLEKVDVRVATPRRKSPTKGES